MGEGASLQQELPVHVYARPSFQCLALRPQCGTLSNTASDRQGGGGYDSKLSGPSGGLVPLYLKRGPYRPMVFLLMNGLLLHKGCRGPLLTFSAMAF